MLYSTLFAIASHYLPFPACLQRFSKRLALPKIENTSQQDLRLGLSLETPHFERISTLFPVSDIP